MAERELAAWIEHQTARSAAAMELAISARHLCRRRARFGQSLTPAAGSVLASPVMADWDPEPDYFFHWQRDSAIVMRSVAELMEDARDDGERQRWRRHFEDFVDFSLQLARIDGSKCEDRRAVPDSRNNKFLRPDTEIRALTGDAVLAEPRFNPDGTIDIFRWSRPQHDGPALRALACLSFLAAGGPLSDALAGLLRLDLDFIIRHAGATCIGPWEEAGQNAWHYYVELVQLGALVHGRAWTAEPARRDAEQTLRGNLEQYWSEEHQVVMAIRPPVADSADDIVDAATLLAVWDADLPEGPHSVFDPRVRKTQSVIEDLFAREMPINRDRAAPALGRSRNDRYFGGGAWYPTTLAAAGLCYRLALAASDDRRALVDRGDAFMATLADLTPSNGALSEQIDRTTGVQRSARHLTWSYAAFISTVRARRRAIAAIGNA